MGTLPLAASKVQKGDLEVHLVDNRARVYGTHVKKMYLELGSPASEFNLVLAFNIREKFVDLYLATESLPKYLSLLRFVELQRQLQEAEVNYLSRWHKSDEQVRMFQFITRVTEPDKQVGRTFIKCQLSEIELYEESMLGPLTKELRIRVTYKEEGQRYIYSKEEGLRSAAVSVR